MPKYRTVTYWMSKDCNTVVRRIDKGGEVLISMNHKKNWSISVCRDIDIMSENGMNQKKVSYHEAKKLFPLAFPFAKNLEV